MSDPRQPDDDPSSEPRDPVRHDAEDADTSRDTSDDTGMSNPAAEPDDHRTADGVHSGPDGEDRGACTLPTDEEVQFRVAVGDELLVVLTRDSWWEAHDARTKWTLRAFSAPTVYTDPAHWAVQGGSFRRDFAPRP